MTECVLSSRRIVICGVICKGSSPILSSMGHEATQMEGIEDVFTNQDLYGIKNMKLFSLGDLLLELANWEAKRKKQ